MRALVPWLIAGLAATALLTWAARRRVRSPWVLLAAVALGVLAAAVARRDPLPALTPERLAAARARWAARGPRDYDIDLRVHADRLEDAAYVVAVRDARIVASARDGVPTTSAEEAYSVPGLFDMLERELDLAADPGRGFGAPAGYRAYLFAEFDAACGYPRRYRRTVGGTTNGVEIRVARFAPVP